MTENTLVGTWSLVSYTIMNEEGVQIVEPFGPSPQGLLIYTESGFMSAHLIPADRSPCRDERPSKASPEEKALAFDTYVGYCGTYKQEGEHITHHVMVSFFQNWVGTDFVRVMKWDGDLLTLIIPSLMLNGVIRIVQLTWCRLSHS